MALREQKILRALSQAARLKSLAVKKTPDLNEALLMVHQVMARAMGRDAAAMTDLEFDGALERSYSERSDVGEAGRRLGA